MVPPKKKCGSLEKTLVREKGKPKGLSPEPFGTSRATKGKPKREGKKLERSPIKKPSLLFPREPIFPKNLSKG